MAGPDGVARMAKLRRDRHLQHTVALVAEQVVSGLDLVQLEAVRHQRRQVDTPELATTAISRRIRSLPPGHSVVTIFRSASPAENAPSGIVRSEE